MRYHCHRIPLLALHSYILTIAIIDHCRNSKPLLLGFYSPLFINAKGVAISISLISKINFNFCSSARPLIWMCMCRHDHCLMIELHVDNLCSIHCALFACSSSFELWFGLVLALQFLMGGHDMISLSFFYVVISLKHWKTRQNIYFESMVLLEPFTFLTLWPLRLPYPASDRA